jgi:hypothetical protein
MVERALSMREVPGSMPGSSISHLPEPGISIRPSKFVAVIGTTTNAKNSDPTSFQAPRAYSPLPSLASRKRPQWKPLPSGPYHLVVRRR